MLGERVLGSSPFITASSLLKIYFYIKLNVYVCLCMWVICAHTPEGQKRGWGPPELEFIGICELPDVVASKQTQVLCKSSVPCGASSLTPMVCC